MAEHLVQLWIRADDDPSGIDWSAWVPKGVKAEYVQTRTFPWQDVQHEISWWITRRNGTEPSEARPRARVRNWMAPTFGVWPAYTS